MLPFDVVITASGAFGTTYTDPFIAAEKLAIQFTVETTGSSGTLTVTPQTSADGGTNWTNLPNLSLTGTGYTAGAVTAMFGADDGSTPHHALMRLAIQASTTVTKVRVLVHGRGRRRPVQRLLYQGAVPTNIVYSPPFPISPSAQRAALQVNATPIGAATTPNITAQLMVSGDRNNFTNQAATAEINAVSLTAGTEVALSAKFDLSAAFALLGRVLLVSGNASANNCNYLRIYLTEWVEGGGQPGYSGDLCAQTGLEGGGRNYSSGDGGLGRWASAPGYPSASGPFSTPGVTNALSAPFVGAGGGPCPCADGGAGTSTFRGR